MFNGAGPGPEVYVQVPPTSGLLDNNVERSIVGSPKQKIGLIRGGVPAFGCVENVTV